MANSCSFELLISGKKKESVVELAKLMTVKYDYGKMELPKIHFSRVYSADFDEAKIDEYDGVYSMIVSGVCAWGVLYCFSRGEGTYYKDINKKFGNKSKATCVQNECKRLNVFVEIFGEESISMTEEHMVCSPRGILKAEEHNIEGMYNEEGWIVNPDICYNWEYEQFTLEDFEKYKPTHRDRTKSRKKHKRKLKKVC